MPPPKKAAKKAAKKVPMHGAKHPHHHPEAKGKDAKDLRRAYEHMGRVEILERHLASAVREAVNTLVTLARTALEEGSYGDAADLLRGAEHLSFAALAGNNSQGIQLSPALESAIADQFDHLTRKADEHWDAKLARSESLSALYQSARKQAAKAYREGAHHQALELIRAAESLAHVKVDGPKKLPGAKRLWKLAV